MPSTTGLLERDGRLHLLSRSRTHMTSPRRTSPPATPRRLRLLRIFHSARRQNARLSRDNITTTVHMVDDRNFHRPASVLVVKPTSHLCLHYRCRAMQMVALLASDLSATSTDCRQWCPRYMWSSVRSLSHQRPRALQCSGRVVPELQPVAFGRGEDRPSDISSPSRVLRTMGRLKRLVRRILPALMANKIPWLACKRTSSCKTSWTKRAYWNRERTQ